MDYDESQDLSSELESAVLDTLGQVKKGTREKEFPPFLSIFPVLRRPFFPGMAAPVVVEPGPYYESLKAISKSNQKFIGIVLTKDEDADIHALGLNDLYSVGVVARILRIIPMEQGGVDVWKQKHSRTVEKLQIEQEPH